MRKHNKKNLSLSTQVVRTLGDGQLDGVAGGLTLIGCNLPTRQNRNTCLPHGCVM